jgi:hypothetical protein
MKLNNLMAIKAVIFVVIGILCVLMPTTFMSLSGMTLNQAGAFTTQLLGAMLILISILLWSARNAPRSDVALRAIVLAVTIGDLIGFIISLLAQLKGAANPLSWIFVALWLLLACGFGYFQFVKPANS